MKWLVPPTTYHGGFCVGDKVRHSSGITDVVVPYEEAYTERFGRPGEVGPQTGWLPVLQHFPTDVYGRNAGTIREFRVDCVEGWSLGGGLGNGSIECNIKLIRRAWRVYIDGNELCMEEIND